MKTKAVHMELYANYAKRTIVVKGRETDRNVDIDIDGVAKVSGIRIDGASQDGPVRGAYYAISSLFHGIGCDDGRILQSKVSIHDFMYLVGPLASYVIGGPVDNLRRVVLAAYTAFAMEWLMEDDYQDIFELMVADDVFDYESGYEPAGLRILYLSVPDSFSILLHLVRDEGFKVSIGGEA